MKHEVIQFILSYHWQGYRPAAVADHVRHRFHIRCTAEGVLRVIGRWTLRHHGKPVLRRNWPCKS